MLFALIAMIVSYIVGSFCSAIIVSELCHLEDPRTAGSKNPGATNVLRLSGKKYAAIVLLCDMLKGLAPLVIGHLFGASPYLLGWMGLAAVLGHIFPIFYGFQGGKGVATALGVMLGISPLLGGLSCVTWLITAKLSRYSSLASIVSIAASPLLVLCSVNRGATFPILVMAGCILYKHKSNITRLKNHEESKINI